VTRNLRINASKDFLIETLHVFRSEGRLQGDCFIEDASQRPDVALMIVRLISPNFWTRIIWGPSLGVQQSLLCYLGNVHIPKLGGAVFVQEDIGALQVSVEDQNLVQAFQTSNNLDEHLPDVVLFKYR
jgi:hypothetical protein